MKNNSNYQNENLTPRQIAAGYYDEDYNDVFLSDVNEAVEYIQQHDKNGDHSEKELNGVLMFGLGIYAYSDVVTYYGIADCSKTNECFYHFKNSDELHRFVECLYKHDGYLEVC